MILNSTIPHLGCLLPERNPNQLFTSNSQWRTHYPHVPLSPACLSAQRPHKSLAGTLQRPEGRQTATACSTFPPQSEAFLLVSLQKYRAQAIQYGLISLLVHSSNCLCYTQARVGHGGSWARQRWSKAPGLLHPADLLPPHCQQATSEGKQWISLERASNWWITRQVEAC